MAYVVTKYVDSQNLVITLTLTVEFGMGKTVTRSNVSQNQVETKSIITAVILKAWV